MLRTKLYLTLLSALSTNAVFAGANFNISPASGFLIPSMVMAGQTVSAYYTITNNTQSTRSNYVIQGLPYTVVQDVSQVNYCPNYITLAAHQSCLLKLNISGKTQSNFALCHGTSCTSASIPLSVSVDESTRLSRVGVGSYAKTNFQSVSLGYTSDDAGVNWALGDLPLPGDVTTSPSGDISFLFGTSCITSGGQCVAVGYYRNSSNRLVPLVYTSSTAGVSWLVNTDPLPLPADSDVSIQNSLNSVTCDATGNICLAIGRYRNANPSNVPLGYTSNNSGSSWAVITTLIPPADVAQFGLPTDILSNNGLSSISCNSTGMQCTTVGAYVNGLISNLPLSYTTSDGGKSWTAYSPLPIPLDAFTTSDQIRMALFGVSCDKSTGLSCVAVGSYKNQAANYVPLSYTSINGGVSWVLNASGLSIPANADVSGNSRSNQLKSVSCDRSGLFCVSVGFYTETNLETNALIYTSNNGGVTWTINSSTLPTPSGATLTGRSLNSVTCDSSGMFCNAVGDYSTSSQRLPLSYVSNNAGLSWTLSTTPLPLPADADVSFPFASLFGVS